MFFFLPATIRQRKYNNTWKTVMTTSDTRPMTTNDATTEALGAPAARGLHAPQRATVDSRRLGAEGHRPGLRTVDGADAVRGQGIFHVKSREEKNCIDIDWLIIINPCPMSIFFRWLRHDWGRRRTFGKPWATWTGGVTRWVGRLVGLICLYIRQRNEMSGFWAGRSQVWDSLAQ